MPKNRLEEYLSDDDRFKKELEKIWDGCKTETEKKICLSLMDQIGLAIMRCNKARRDNA